MTEWRAFRGWSPEVLRARVDALGTQRNFDAADEEMTIDRGWHHYYSEAVIAHEPEGHECFSRACTALANYQFSDPSIVVAHFDPRAPLLGRRILLEVKVLGLRYLCSALVSRVREDPGVYGFRYDTLHGHIEQGMEWFLLTKDAQGDIRFRIEARWRRGELPNWWSRVGFMLLSTRYQRRWHVAAHHRMARLVHGRVGDQGVRVQFTRHSQRK